MLLYSLILVPVMLGLALLFALLLDAQRVGLQRFARLSIFLPYAVPTVIGSLLWGFLYLPTVSPFPAILSRLGLSMPNLFATHTVLLSVANIGVWGGTGFNMIVIYTALRAMPSELYEAARIDGASQVQIALRIKIPMISPALVLTGVFSIIATLQVFNEPETLAPLTNTISPDWMPLMKIYDLAFNDNNAYGAAALSVVIAARHFRALLRAAAAEQQVRVPGTVRADGTTAGGGALTEAPDAADQRPRRRGRTGGGGRCRCRPPSYCWGRCTACCRWRGCWSRRPRTPPSCSTRSPSRPTARCGRTSSRCPPTAAASSGTG